MEAEELIREWKKIIGNWKPGEVADALKLYDAWKSYSYLKDATPDDLREAIELVKEDNALQEVELTLAARIRQGRLSFHLL